MILAVTLANLALTVVTLYHTLQVRRFQKVQLVADRINGTNPFWANQQAKLPPSMRRGTP